METQVISESEPPAKVGKYQGQAEDNRGGDKDGQCDEGTIGCKLTWTFIKKGVLRERNEADSRHDPGGQVGENDQCRESQCCPETPRGRSG